MRDHCTQKCSQKGKYYLINDFPACYLEQCVIFFQSVSMTQLE